MQRKFFVLGAGLGLAMLFFCTWLWQPERQLRLHQRDLLRAVEARDWDRLSELVADTYADRWGHDKNFLLGESKEVFRQFLLLKIEARSARIELAGDGGLCEQALRLEARGGPFAEIIANKVNGLSQPFRFRWQLRSAKPWDWQLTEFDQRELPSDLWPSL
jgi:hypothetical protein